MISPFWEIKENDRVCVKTDPSDHFPNKVSPYISKFASVLVFVLPLTKLEFNTAFFNVEAKHELKLKCAASTKIPWPCRHSPKKGCLRPQVINLILLKQVKSLERHPPEAKGCISLSNTT